MQLYPSTSQHLPLTFPTAAAAAGQELEPQQPQPSPANFPQHPESLHVPPVQDSHLDSISGNTVVTPDSNFGGEVPAESVTREDVVQPPQLQVSHTTQALISPLLAQAQSSASGGLENPMSPLLMPILTIGCARPSEAWVGCGGLDPRFYVRFQDVTLHEVSFWTHVESESDAMRALPWSIMRKYNNQSLVTRLFGTLQGKNMLSTSLRSTFQNKRRGKTSGNDPPHMALLRRRFKSH